MNEPPTELHRLYRGYILNISHIILKSFYVKFKMLYVSYDFNNTIYNI